MTEPWEELPIEELQKKLEAATSSEGWEAGWAAQRPGFPDDRPVPEDAAVAQWRQVWKAFGRLLNLAEQTLPEPAWKLPAEGAEGMVERACYWVPCPARHVRSRAALPRKLDPPERKFAQPEAEGYPTDGATMPLDHPGQKFGQPEQPSCRPSRPVRPISGGTGAGWSRYLAAAAVGVALVGGGFAVWWVGQPRPQGPDQTSLVSGLVSGSDPSPGRDSTAEWPLPIQKDSPLGPTGNRPAPPAQPSETQASETAQQSSSPPSDIQETPAWDDQWEDALLSIQQIAREIQGLGLFQDDPFSGIRQKIQEIQTELDQTML